MAILYKHWREDKKEPFYVGIGTEEKRAYDNDDKNKIWNDIIKKNNNKYIVEIVFRDLSWEEACRREKLYIKLYGRIDKETGILSNMTDGGEGTKGLKWSDESRKKISKQRKGIKQKQETIDKRVAKRLGTHLSEEHKQKLRESKLGEKNPMFGKKYTKEQSKNHSEKLKGRFVSEETIAKIVEKTRKKIINTETKEIFSSAKEVALILNMKVSTLRARLTGQNKNKLPYMYMDKFKELG